MACFVKVSKSEYLTVRVIFFPTNRYFLTRLQTIDLSFSSSAFIASLSYIFRQSHAMSYGFRIFSLANKIAPLI